MDIDSYISALESKLKPHSNPEYAVEMKAYMKDRSEFLGIKSPLRKVLFKEFFEENGLIPAGELAAAEDILFDMKAREYQYFGIELAGRYRKQWTRRSVRLFEKMATRRSWWDSVDALRSVCLRYWFPMFPDDRAAVTDRWIRSGNIWLQRLSVTFQLGFKERTDTALLAGNIARLADSEEFFVQKAIGWALRDYARTDPGFVIELTGKQELKPLSRREALKHLK